MSVCELHSTMQENLYGFFCSCVQLHFTIDLLILFNKSLKLWPVIFDINLEKKYSKEVLEQVETTIKYEGYIKKLIKEVERMLKLEYKKIPSNIFEGIFY